MKSIAVITSTRAEYGLLMPVIKALRCFEDDNFKVDLIVTGTHLSDDFGNTVSEIENDCLRIDLKIEIPVASSNINNISHNQAVTLEKFTSLFVDKKYSGIVILGDRYEMLSIAIAAGNTQTPVFHINGGDTTEGAIDEWIRHSITKISYLHFPTNESSKKRVIQLGENPNRVYNFGSTSIDNIINSADMTKQDALASVGMDVCKYAVCTYHPVTMDNGDVHKQINEFLAAIKAFPDIQFIVTKSNADQGGAKINELLDKANEEISNIHVFASLGVRRYLSLMRNAEFVLGNSSSGIIETPAFHIPTVNIGDRQRGRLQSESIINCGEIAEEIIDAIYKAESLQFRSLCKDVISPYGDGHAAEKIAKKIYEVVSCGKIDLKKKFYDIERSVL